MTRRRTHSSVRPREREIERVQSRAVYPSGRTNHPRRAAAAASSPSYLGPDSPVRSVNRGPIPRAESGGPRGRSSRATRRVSAGTPRSQRRGVSWRTPTDGSASLPPRVRDKQQDTNGELRQSVNDTLVHVLVLSRASVYEHQAGYVMR